jgi:hypothetical protein
MKRFLASLFISLVLVSLPGPAAATSQKTKHSTKAAAVEQECPDDPPRPIPASRIKPARKIPAADDGTPVTATGPTPFGQPIELAMTRASGKKFDLRSLPQIAPQRFERPERQEPPISRTIAGSGVNPPTGSATPSIPPRNAPAPPTIMNFDGLDYANWGAGHPPDPNGDAGPTYYIQTINTSIGIFRKSDGVRVAAFTFNTLMSQGAFGNLCDTDNFGDPVVLYDSFEDRWIITDFAFQLDGADNVVFPPGSFQCVAASMSGDPVSGGWNFYSINTAGGLGDYPKFGIWPDALYMSANMFDYSASGSFQDSRVYAFNKAQMYAGNPSVQVVTFDAPAADFSLLPSNARLQAGTPPPGTPDYYLSTEEYLNALTVYKFHVDWNNIASSTFTGPDVPVSATSWPDAEVPNAPSQGGNNLDVLEIRAMAQNQYTNLGGVESLWASHTVRRGDTHGFAAPRWYQVDVTGGTVNPNIPQAATWDPDGANVIYRFLPSVAVDRAGDMALGYSTSSSTTKPAIKYAGRLSTDPANTLGQTETVLIPGTGTQLGGCGGTCTRWGDYSAMTLDPNGCTFWYTNEYYASDGLNFLTRIGSFAFPSCTPVGAGGTISGTVTATTGGAPIGGATIQFGARSTTTDSSGLYSFLHIPAGSYPAVITASFPGFVTGTSSNINVTDGGTTTQNFSLATAPATACLTDTTQADFQSGVPANVDLATNPGDVILFKPSLDQQNTSIGSSSAVISTTTYVGQTFTPSVTGLLTKADINLFCSSCSAVAQPNLTLSVRATAAGLPTGADIATATITGFSSSTAQSYTGVFGAPPTLNAGTMYALVIHPLGTPTGSGSPAYALVTSSTNVYAAGAEVFSTDSGGTWGAQTNDLGFTTYMDSGFAPSGTQTSSVKDAQPAVGTSPTWTTLSWTAATPSNTSLQFQVAGSHSASGPFNFIGPDGTAATFFTTSGASISELNGFRYVEYKAYLATTSSTVSPTLSDVTVCFADAACGSSAPAITPTPTPVCGTSAGNTASGPAGMLNYSWSITNGSITGGETSQTVTYSAGSSGSVGLMLVVTDNTGCVTSNTISVPINPTPPAPTITAGGPTTFCTGGSVTLTSSSATGNQWFLNGNPIGGATAHTYMATAAGSYTVKVTTGGCTGAASAVATVAVNSIPATPTITPGGPTTFCTGGSVTLTSSGASGNQWYLGGNPIGGATAKTYSAAASGNYTVTVTTLGCTSAASASTSVTVNPIPATPTITPGGPTTFCAGGSVTLTSSSATGNQWLLAGNPIGGATAQTYSASAGGSYTVKVTTLGCTSAASAATTVTVNPKPNATITAPASVTTGSTGNVASVASAGAGATYTWGITGGSITAGSGTASITFTAGAAGTLTLNVTVTTSASCSDAKSANVNVAFPPVTVTSVTPSGGTAIGGTAVTINGTGFLSGATVTFGGTAATNVVVVSATSITAKTPAHAIGSVSVIVTNANTASGTLAAGYLYKMFDPNADGVANSADIFFLVNYLFLGGPAPHGASGMLSGDANGDGHVNSADIFYIVNYLFLGGPKPADTPGVARALATAAPGIGGSITLGKPIPRGGRYIVPVIMTASGNSIVPQAMSLRVHFDSDAAIGEVTVRKAGAAKDLGVAFEISRRAGNDLSYLVSYGGLALGQARSGTVAEIEIDPAGANVVMSIDPLLTMLCDQAGTITATVDNGKLEVKGTTIRSAAPRRSRTPGSEVN